MLVPLTIQVVSDLGQLVFNVSAQGQDVTQSACHNGVQLFRTTQLSAQSAATTAVDKPRILSLSRLLEDF